MPSDDREYERYQRALSMIHRPYPRVFVADGECLVDLGYRVELREESTDPSVPTGGRLVGYADQIDGKWQVHTRAGEVVERDDSLTAVTYLLLGVDDAGPERKERAKRELAQSVFGLMDVMEAMEQPN